SEIALVLACSKVLPIDAPGVTEDVAQLRTAEVLSDRIHDDLHTGQVWQLFAQVERGCLMQPVLGDYVLKRILRLSGCLDAEGGLERGHSEQLLESAGDL